jgi:hypothetical protein
MDDRYMKPTLKVNTFCFIVLLLVQCNAAFGQATDSASTVNSAPPNTVRTSDGNLRPAEGYRWVNANNPKDIRVEWTPGLVKARSGFRTEAGYRWLNPDDPDDLRVVSISNNTSAGNSAAGGAGESPRVHALTGNWRGTYLCAQGLTNLRLSIFQSNATEVAAIFAFSANASNPSVPSGSYNMTGTYDSQTNRVTLRATSWISQPADYLTVDLAGFLSPEKTRISGDMQNSGCGMFELEKESR